MKRSQRWKKHVSKWNKCEECELCETRKNVVLYRGGIPCDVLFIGEGPGRGEDLLGSPFSGEAGIMLDRMIARCPFEGIKIGMTNLVSCLPYNPETEKIQMPDKEHIKACTPRLQELISLVDPKVIVCVGKLAEKWIPKILDEDQQEEIVLEQITHPAALLRSSLSNKAMGIQLSIVRLTEVCETINKRKPKSKRKKLKK